MARNRFDFMIDAATQLKDAGAVAASAASQVGGAARVLDIGGPASTNPTVVAGNVAPARLDFRVITDVSAIDVSSGDEKYEIEVQVSNDITFATGINVVASLKLGDSSVTGNSADSVVGRYEIHACSEVLGAAYRYVRLYNRIAGTTPSINYTAWLVQA
jgi:hypothetical protein